MMGNGSIYVQVVPKKKVKELDGFFFEEAVVFQSTAGEKKIKKWVFLGIRKIESLFSFFLGLDMWGTK